MIYRDIIIACWMAFIGYWAITGISAKRIIRQDAPWKRVLGGLVFAAAVIAASSRHLSLLDMRLIPASPAWGVIGDAICILGVSLMIWSRTVLGTNWSPRPAITEGHELVTGGPYSVIRHPIYTGLLVAACGAFLVLGQLAWLLILIFAVGWIIRRIVKEEALMTGLFGATYAEYRKRTMRLIPFVW